MKSRTSVIVMLGLIGAAAVWLGACGEEKGITIGEKAIQVSGIVTDSSTGLPIDSVRMSWGDTLYGTVRAFTDSTGFYQMGVPTSMKVVYARKALYKTKGRQIDFGEVRPDLTLPNFDFALQPE